MNGVHTLVVAGKIKRGRESDYERWVGKLVTALHGTPGYDGMTAISSPDPQGSVGTLLIRFCSAEDLSEWEDSPVRRSLIGEGDQLSASYYHAGAGQELFFSMPGMSAAPSRWKMCFLTIPTVYLLFNITLFALVRLVPGCEGMVACNPYGTCDSYRRGTSQLCMSTVPQQDFRIMAVLGCNAIEKADRRFYNP